MNIQLGDGTQEVLLRDVAKAVCRCGRGLAWKLLQEAQLSAIADCECGMSYTAWQPETTVKIEVCGRLLFNYPKPTKKPRAKKSRKDTRQ